MIHTCWAFVWSEKLQFCVNLMPSCWLDFLARQPLYFQMGLEIERSFSTSDLTLFK